MRFRNGVALTKTFKIKNLSKKDEAEMGFATGWLCYKYPSIYFIKKKDAINRACLKE
jgi:hypothetical protein